MNPVHGKAVAQLGKLPLQFVQHSGRKVGIADGAGGKHGDFLCRRRDFCLPVVQSCDGHIGKLLVSHVHGFLQDFLPGGLGQEPCVVDGLGDCVPGQPKGVCDVLNRNSFCHTYFSVFVVTVCCSVSLLLL